MSLINGNISALTLEPEKVQDMFKGFVDYLYEPPSIHFWRALSCSTPEAVPIFCRVISTYPKGREILLHFKSLEVYSVAFEVLSARQKRNIILFGDLSERAILSKLHEQIEPHTTIESWPKSNQIFTGNNRKPSQVNATMGA